MLKQLKSDFKRTIYWNKYLSNRLMERQNSYLDYLIGPRFQGVIWLFTLSFGDKAVRERDTRYFLQIVKIKDHNIIIDGKNQFDQPVKNDLRTHNIKKIATDQEYDYTSGFFTRLSYFKNYYKMISINLSTNQVYQMRWPKALQQINLMTISFDQKM